jgi:hypothetical protein
VVLVTEDSSCTYCESSTKIRSKHKRKRERKRVTKGKRQRYKSAPDQTGGKVMQAAAKGSGASRHGSGSNRANPIPFVLLCNVRWEVG